jgi:uncharacterized protein YjbI with pentapeptide repeats
MEVKKPLLPPGALDDAPPTTCLASGASLACLIVGSLDAAGERLEGIALDQVRIERPVFSAARFEDAQFRDVELTKVEGAGLMLSKCDFHRVSVAGGRFSGTIASETRFGHVSFERCKQDLSTFLECSFANVRFTGCDLRGVAFEGCTFERVEFNDCDLAETDFRDADYKRTTMIDVDFRTSKIADIKSVRALKGARITSSQMLELAYHLAVAHGLRVDD